MAKYWIAVSMLIAACLLTEVTSRPAEEEYQGSGGQGGGGRGRRPGFPGDFRRLTPKYTSSADYFAFGDNFKDISQKDNFSIVVSPLAHSLSPKGVSIANPISQVFVKKGSSGIVQHSPSATAVAGPGGIAHAQSDLLHNTVEYFPFYGGAKGQYLEVTKDRSGTVLKEKIVNEDNISSENIVKNRDENLISKVLNANLQNIQAISTNLLKLHNLGRKTGYLRRSDKILFKEQLSNLGETASNLIKLIDEIGDDVDMLFKKNVTQRQSHYEDDVGEEGIGIDSPSNIDGDLGEVLSGATFSYAKPIGLAVIGENGFAASNPKGTAVANTGIAIARPIATAIAGIDPALLGIKIIGHEAKRRRGSTRF